jgi:hypothetical protein
METFIEPFRNETEFPQLNIANSLMDKLAYVPEEG